jgi:hypothetical protein
MHRQALIWLLKLRPGALADGLRALGRSLSSPSRPPPWQQLLNACFSRPPRDVFERLTAASVYGWQRPTAANF